MSTPFEDQRNNADGGEEQDDRAPLLRPPSRGRPRRPASQTTDRSSRRFPSSSPRGRATVPTDHDESREASAARRGSVERGPSLPMGLGAGALPEIEREMCELQERETCDIRSLYRQTLTRGSTSRRPGISEVFGEVVSRESIPRGRITPAGPAGPLSEETKSPVRGRRRSSSDHSPTSPPEEVVEEEISLSDIKERISSLYDSHIEEKISGHEQEEHLQVAHIAAELTKELTDMQNQREPWQKRALEWRHLNFTVGDTQILKDCYGRLVPGQVAAMIGPSGAGKSTLLNLLAGRQRWSGGNNLKCIGEVYFGAQRIESPDDLQRMIGYVPQFDQLLGTQTVRETLDFAASMRLSARKNKPDRRKKIVDQLLRDLDLFHVADVVVGDALVKGISGGQKKRVSVGVELITRPKILFLDEPTSGLDSFSSLALVKKLKDIAVQERVIICATIHQPSSDLFAMFDRVMCLRFGEVLYHGICGNLAHEFRGKWGGRDVKTVTLIEDFMAKISGKPIPVGFGTCDWLLFQSQMMGEEEVREDREQTARIFEIWNPGSSKRGYRPVIGFQDCEEDPTPGGDIEEGGAGGAPSASTLVPGENQQESGTTGSLRGPAAATASSEELRNLYTNAAMSSPLVPSPPGGVTPPEHSPPSSSSSTDSSPTDHSRTPGADGKTLKAFHALFDHEAHVAAERQRLLSDVMANPPSIPQKSCPVQIVHLTKREWVHRWRMWSTLIFRLVIPVVQMSVHAFAYYGCARDLAAGRAADGRVLVDGAGFTAGLTTVQFGLAQIFFIVFLSPGQSLLLSMPSERAVFLR